MSGKRMEVLAAVVAAAAVFAVAAPAGAQAASSHPAMAKKAPAAQATMKVKEESAGLAAQATVSADSAQKIALSQVPHGRVREAEIEQNKEGTLVYSYDIKASGKSGVDEVLVDAKTGAVVSKTHETAAAEAKEMASEKKASSAAKKSSSTKTATASTKPAKSMSSKSTSSKSTSSKSMAPKPATKDSTTKP
jgi:uncharacterized membrane protein YkoI